MKYRKVGAAAAVVVFLAGVGWSLHLSHSLAWRAGWSLSVRAADKL